MYLNLNRSQRGIGLPATVFLIVILSLIVLAMSELNESSARSFGQDLNATKAFYAAESGAQIALNRVFVGTDTCATTGNASDEDASLADIDFDSGSGTPGLINCDVVLACGQVTVSGTNYMTFNSTATCGSGLEQATRAVQVRAHEPTG